MILSPVFQQPKPIVYRSAPPFSWRNWGQPVTPPLSWAHWGQPGQTVLPPQHPLLISPVSHVMAVAPTNASASSVSGNHSAASLVTGNDSGTTGAKTPVEAPLVAGSMPGGISPLVYAALGLLLLGWFLR